MSNFRVPTMAGLTVHRPADERNQGLLPAIPEDRVHWEGIRLLELACRASLDGVSAERVLVACGYGHGSPHKREGSGK